MHEGRLACVASLDRIAEWPTAIGGSCRLPTRERRHVVPAEQHGACDTGSHHTRNPPLVLMNAYRFIMVLRLWDVILMPGFLALHIVDAVASIWID
jgi:hypothetical protein